MHNRSLFLTAALLAATSGVAGAQVVRQIPSDNTAYGTTAAEFLLLAPTARGMALGNSFSALVTDISSLYPVHKLDGKWMLESRYLSLIKADKTLQPIAIVDWRTGETKATSDKPVSAQIFAR